MYCIVKAVQGRSPPTNNSTGATNMLTLGPASRERAAGSSNLAGMAVAHRGPWTPQVGCPTDCAPHRGRVCPYSN